MASQLKYFIFFLFHSRIQFRYGAVWAPVRGYDGNDKDYLEYFLNPGEYIATVELYSGAILDIVTFYTQNGKLFNRH